MNRWVWLILAIIVVFDIFLFFVYLYPKLYPPPSGTNAKTLTSCDDLSLALPSSKCYLLMASGKGQKTLWILGKITGYENKNGGEYVKLDTPYSSSSLLFKLDPNTMQTCKLKTKNQWSGATCTNTQPNQTPDILKTGSEAVFVLYSTASVPNDNDFTKCPDVNAQFIKDFTINNLGSYQNLLSDSCAPIVEQVRY